MTAQIYTPPDDVLSAPQPADIHERLVANFFPPGEPAALAAPVAPAAPVEPPRRLRDPNGQFAPAAAPVAAAPVGEPPPVEPVEPVEGQPADPAAAAPEGEEQPAVQDGIRTTSELAEYFGVEDDALMSELHFSTEDGAEVPLAQIVDEWSNAPDAAQAQVAAESSFLQEQGAAREQFQSQTAQVQQFVGAIRDEIARMGPSDRDVWEAERTGDTNQAAILRQQRQALDGVFESALGGIEQMRNQTHQQGEQERVRLEAAEESKLQRAWPELKDPTIKQAKMDEMKTYLESYGFGAQEVSELRDSRMILVVRDAMFGKTIQKSGKERLAAAKQRGITRPTSPPRARADLSTPAQDRNNRLAAASKQHAEGQSVESAAAVFRELLS